MAKLKEFRVQMDGSMQVWARDADDAVDYARQNLGSWLYATETGEEMEDDDDA